MVRKIVAAALVLVLLIALAAYAQNQQPAKPSRQKLVVGGAAGPQGLAARMPMDKTFALYRNVYLVRYLLPPGRAELERLAVVIGLTEEQKQKILDLCRQFYSKAKPLFEQKAAGTKEVLDLLQSPSPNKGALNAAANKVSQAENAILDAEFDFWLAFRSILNAQQQQGFAQFMQQKAQREIGGPRPPAPGVPKPTAKP